MSLKANCVDALVIGAGAAGLAAAARLVERGHSCILVDRERERGGILLQCIHSGFGLQRFSEELTGPEFAARLAASPFAMQADFRPDTTVLSFRSFSGIDGKPRFESWLSSSRSGAYAVESRSVILAMGSRERNRGNVRIAGDRPAGIFTAGLAQRLLNMDGYLPGRKAVIIGSGDIGLIMARRMRLCGAEVSAVVEILPRPSGLARNVAQCLDDFGIPLLVSHATLAIRGRDRVEGVEIAPVEQGVIQTGKKRFIACDTVLLSVGLVPENELSARSGVEINPVTNGPLVDERLMTTVAGIFAAGNVLHIHDLADWASEEAERAGDNCADWLSGSNSPLVRVPVRAGKNIRYTVPAFVAPSREWLLRFRSLVALDKALLTVTLGDRLILERTLSWLKPAEMVSCTVPATEMAVHEGAEIRLDVVELP